MKLIVNGNELEIDPKPGEMLAELLRERLGLTGTKIGCNEDECGACTVLVDGSPILSCNYPAVKADGKEVLTIEGLAKLADDLPENQTEKGKVQLHPLQEAFILHGAVQCGFCTPGQLMNAYALLQKNLEPTDEEIKIALKDTLCRCAGYSTIMNAIKAAGTSIRTHEPVKPPSIRLSSKPLNVIGRINIRPDAVEKVKGTAKFTDDLKFDDMLYARVKRADVPSAILKGVDISDARKLPGVYAILTADDIPGEKNHGVIIPDWPIMIGIGERIRYVGDAIAIVAAETPEIAAEAIELIQLDFELLPVVSNPVDAKKIGAPKIHTNGNLLKHIKVRKGDVEKGFEDADVIIEHVFHTATTDHAFLEPECSIARPTTDGRMEVYVGSQIPYGDRDQVARALGVPDKQVHIVGQLMGGGFGGKEDIAGQIHAALLANATGRPVKLLFDRHESLIVHPKRHATQIRVKLGAKNDGHLVAVETELYGDTGAYASLGEKVMTRATTHSSGAYESDNARADCYAMYTNNPPAGAFRGFGALQSGFAVECSMDILAQKLEMDPIEIRKKNALHVGSMTSTGQVLTESVGLLDCIDAVSNELRKVAGNNPFESKTFPGKPYMKRSWGFAVAFKNTGLGGGAPDKAGAEVEMYEDGTLEVRTASAELGQGLVTVLQMIVSEEFNVQPSKVKVLVMDTDLAPDGGPTTASRQTYVTGNAARYASKMLKQAIASVLAEKFDYPPEQIKFIEGLAQVGETMIPFGDIVGIMKENNREAKLLYEYWAPETKPLGEGGNMHFAFSFAAQAVEVEVNTNTGEVKVLQAIAANDVGKAINPLGLQGQFEGGIVMGIGHALTENFIVEEGKVITDRMARYRVPSITMTPKITAFVIEDPTKEGPYGAKGVGEIVSIPTIPAIANAIYNAVGVRIDTLPVEQEYIVNRLKIQKQSR